MGKLLTAISIIFVVCVVTSGIALGLAGIGVDTASGRQAQAFEENFGVELSVVTTPDGTSIPVAVTQDGYYLNANELLKAYHGEISSVAVYTIENGIITGQNYYSLSFSDGGRYPIALLNILEPTT